MRLNQIDIKNFRLLLDSSIRLDSTTILVGPNNSGKTSMAEALQLFTADSSRRFSINDFSLACRKSFDKVQSSFFKEPPESEDQENEPLPLISITLHFDYEDVPEDLAVVGDLLMDLNEQSYKVALQIQFAVKDREKLASKYCSSNPDQKESLFDFLSLRLHEYYTISYFKVAPETGERELLPDRTTLDQIIKVSFIAAQRHIDDQESGQATRLSRLLHLHYERHYKNVEPEGYKDIEDTLRTHSTDLSVRYKSAFAGLINGLQQFGYPQNRAPQLSIKAEFDAGTLFKDNTHIYYATQLEADPSGENAASYDLPEKYNGLGFKNLIYMILQIISFCEKLKHTDGAQPRVHLIIIEEPEVHLHPQVQGVFIKQISNFLNPGESGDVVQLMLTTHSSHIVADCGFSPVRYFRLKGGTVEIKDLLKFEKDEAESDAIKFLARYLTLTKCDLFFSDKAILIEGQVERLLLPKMIEQCGVGAHANLAREYLSVIEVGGAYAHVFKSLVKFIEVPTLIITDLDSISRDKKKCSVSIGHSTSNATLKKWLPGKSDLAELMNATNAEKTDGLVHVAYQVPDQIDLHCGRSFEEAFIYCNADWLYNNREKLIGTSEFSENNIISADDLKSKAFDLSIHKVNFALDLISNDGWKTPKYIADGLAWLASQNPQ